MASSVTATFVFTDLVDSTATAARLGPDAAEELRQTHFRLLRGAVTSSGGTEVKNLGDGLMVVYSSPSRALAGAAAMQQAVEHHNLSADEPLGVRVGISAGEAVEDEGDYFGDPVVEAARLCAAAAGAQILASGVVRTLVGRHATQTFVEVGPLELKGLPEPVDAVEVLWEPAVVEGSVPLPGRLAGVASDALFGFFGRTPELEAVDEVRKEAQSSQRCQAVFVAGEAGMGKTSLLAQAARTAHAQGEVVVFGHSDEGTGIAYQPWIELLATLVRHGDPASVAALRAPQRSALSRLVPDVGADGERVNDPDTERLLMLEAVVELLAAESQRHPVMVVLDDLHWADTASLQLLRHVIASSTPMSVVIAGTYRHTDLGRTDPLTQLLADLHREANVERIALQGLDDVDLVELLAAAAGHDLDDDGIGLAHVLRRETDGNPFFAAELLRHLGESGGIVLGEDGRWALAGDFDAVGLPTSVRDVVGRRVARLGEDAQRVLSLAAVIGREFDLDLLAGLTELDEDLLLDLLDAAVAAAVLTETDVPSRYRFAHALVQHALYDELSAARRQRAHARIGEALEASAVPDDAEALGELARHWIAATRPTEADKAIHYARRAGDAARDALAPNDAVRWYEQALELLDRQAAPDAHTRAELLIACGSAQRAAARPEYRVTLVEAVEAAKVLADDDLLTDAALGFRSPSTGQLLGDEVAAGAVTEALRRLPEAPTAARARLLAVLAEAYDASTHWRESRAVALEAIETARSAGDPLAFVEVVNHTWAQGETPDRREQSIADVEQALAHADESGDPLARVQTRRRALWCRYQRADVVGAERLVREVGAIADSLGLAQPRYEAALVAAGRFLLAGDADAAAAANEEVLEFGTAAGVPEVLGIYGGLTYAICEHRGDIDEIVDFFLEVERDNPSIAALRSTLPAMLCELGRLDEARDRLEREAASGFDYPYDSLWVAAMVNLADAAASTANGEVAQALVERLAPYADHVNSPSGVVVSGGIARPLARAATVTGDVDRAEEWFTLAHTIHEKLQAPYWTARTQLDHADLCLAGGGERDVDRAREMVTVAAATAAAHGCAGLTRRAASLRDLL